MEGYIWQFNMILSVVVVVQLQIKLHTNSNKPDFDLLNVKGYHVSEGCPC